MYPQGDPNDEYMGFNPYDRMDLSGGASRAMDPNYWAQLNQWYDFLSRDRAYKSDPDTRYLSVLYNSLSNMRELPSSPPSPPTETPTATRRTDLDRRAFP